MKIPRQALLLVLACAAGSLAAQDQEDLKASRPGRTPFGPPIELRMKRAGSTTLDLRLLPQTPPEKRERPEREEPEPHPIELPGRPAVGAPIEVPAPTAPAPPPIKNFDGLDFASWGAGHPPDTNGDVGPTYYVETINTSIGIYRKSDGVRIAAFTFNTLMSQGNFGNLCDTNNFGDPVVVYDSFEDRWIITDFAFKLDGSGNVVNPPGSFECFAASKTGDPVAGGWNFYSINTAGGLGDYPKFGIWPDGLYMSVNMFGYAAGSGYLGPRVYALNKAQMYSGSPTVQIVTFDGPASDFTLLPSNARLQTGTPPPGTPNYYLSTWMFLNALTVYKFHVDWDRIGNSTFSGPDTPLAATSWPNASVPNAPSLGGNNLDVLQIRAMVQNQYTNLGGAESLWDVHTVRRADTSGFAAPRWYQVNVTGGTVAASLPQAATWDPDGANVIHRFMPSVAVDRAGDMALGYSTSDATTKPAIKYAGRLSADPPNTLTQTEQLLIQGAGTQTGNCGASTCTRWGDYSAMTLDPDGCTFWYTNEYYAVDGLNHHTRIGSFAFPSCTPVGAGGTLSGTVTATPGGAPIAGATVALGSRTRTTDVSGQYSFTGLPAGTYPSVTASAPGYNPASATSIVVTDGGTTTQDFSLGHAPTSACPLDTTQADFQAGVATNLDLSTSPGDVTLLNAPTIDQQNTTLGNFGVGITVTTWGGQTFTPAVTGVLTKVDINLFCSGCTGTTPNLTLSVRATSGGLPTGADIASGTLGGFSSGAAGFYTVTFGSPPTLNAGTQYAVVIRPTANPSAGTYALTRSGSSTTGSDVYAGGTRVVGASSGTVWSIATTGGVTTDAGFKTYVQAGYATSGNLVSSNKDGNPPVGFTTSWSTLSWTGTTPAGTVLRFQVAGSDTAFGSFNFVGPDGTAGTFFTTSGASISQFSPKRYLKYKAYLSTSDNTVTPTLSDVTVCYSVAAGADLSITKTDGQVTATPGSPITYTITASNAGPSPATGATVADALPAVLTGATWTCVGAGGGTCTANGSGNINDSVNLPVGASVTYTLTATLDPAATGTLSNTATVSLSGGGVSDPNPGNNSATDTDAIIYSCSAPLIVVPDGRLTQAVIPAGGTLWLAATLKMGSSYSVELTNTTGTGGPPGTLTMFAGDDGCGPSSSLAPADTSGIDPGANPAAVRVSFTASGTFALFHARLQNPSASPITFTFGWSDTTMYSAAWSTTGSFDTFYSFQNTTGATLSGTLSLFDPTGGLVSAFPISVPAGRTTATNTSALGVGRNQVGTARFTHNGPPGALAAEAAIANFAISPAYVQPVKFMPARER